MLRRSAVAAAVIVLLFGTAGEAQTPPSAAAPTTAPAPAKPVAKKPAAKTNAGAKPSGPTDSGRCQVGVIVATEDAFSVQKVGLTVFGNEFTEITTKWGRDDFIFNRVKAAAGATQVRRIPYPKGAFDIFYHPQQRTLFRDTKGELMALIKQIAGNTSCERYLVIARAKGQLQGTNQELVGIGVLNRGVGVFEKSYVFAYLSINVLDGQTFEIGRNPHANLEGALSRIAANLTKNENMHEVKDFKFPESPADAANDAALREGTRNLLAEYLDKYMPAYFKPQ
jgi:hypothetical protein